MGNHENKVKANTKDGEKLCVACGFCCDGTLFKLAKVEENENIKIHSSLGIEVDEEKTWFTLPCLLHDSVVGCTVYESELPVICGKSRCRVLEPLQKGEISLEEAMQIVAETRTIKEKIVLEINKKASFFKLTPLKEKYSLLFLSNKDDVEFIRANAGTFLSYASLEHMLKKFRHIDNTK